jgi:MoaA/NifB/PqqE/SkfB family radical SAM enzyme
MSRYGTSVSLGQLEEPLLHPQIIDIVNSFASRGIYVHLTTNGTMVNSERAKALVHAGLKSIAFSIDAITPETYRRIRGHNLNEVVENMRYILRLRKESGFDIYTRACIINQEGADQEISKFIEFWKEEGIDCVSVYQLTEVQENAEVRVNKLNYPLDKENRYPCKQLWEQCFIYPNGEVSTCCTTMFSVPKFGILSMGSVRDHTLKEIWCGERYSEVRRSLIDAMWEKIPQCEHCLIWRNYETIYEKIDRATIRGYNPIEEFYFFDRRKSL